MKHNYTNEVPNGKDFYSIELKEVIAAMEAKGITDINLDCTYNGIADDSNGESYFSDDSIAISGTYNGKDITFYFDAEHQIYDDMGAALDCDIDGEKAAGNESMTEEECEMVEKKMGEWFEYYSNQTEIPRLLCGLTMYRGFSVNYDFDEIYEFSDMPFLTDETVPINEALEFIAELLDEAVAEAEAEAEAEAA